MQFQKYIDMKKKNNQNSSYQQNYSNQHNNYSQQQYNQNNIDYKKPKKSNGITKKIIIAVIALLLLMSCSTSIIDSSRPKYIPDVTGTEYYTGESLLKSALSKEISVEEIKEYNDNIEEGNIISTEPKAGTEWKEGTIIKVHVSKGKKKIMPDLIGKSIEEGERLLSEINCEYIIDKEEYSDYKKGTILKTGYEAGTDMRDKYGYVDITVSKGRIQDLKDSAKEIGYEKLSRYPDSYKDVALKMTVKITKIDNSKIFGIKYSTAYWATYNGKTVILNDNREKQEPAIRVGDKITLYGFGDGTSTIDITEKEYQGGLLIGFSYDKTVKSYDVPCINIEYLDLK